MTIQICNPDLFVGQVGNPLRRTRKVAKRRLTTGMQDTTPALQS
jgi:hypothetical protein